MIPYSSYYNILNVSENSSAEEIKHAFRTLALIHHPDKNNNTPESQTRFILLSNAYHILTDPEKRKEYDSYLRNSFILHHGTRSSRQADLSALPGKTGKPLEELLNYFNFLLWDIEDIIQGKEKFDWNTQYSRHSLQEYLLMILAFMDQWVLEPAGFRDYFMEARKKEKINPADYIKDICENRSRQQHRPFSSLSNYFYDIRKRMDKFMKKITESDLQAKIPDQEIPLMDCVIETQNYVVHYLSYLLQIKDGKIHDIPVFEHSNPCFTK